MRPASIAPAAAAFVIGGITTGAVLVGAQPAPAPVPQEAAPHPAMMGWGHGHGRPFHEHPFALIYRQPDRQLTAADVQKIAEGFLLWNGNHAWKVTDVAPTPGGPIGFSLSTPEGSVVAKFTMDPHSGSIVRAG